MFVDVPAPHGILEGVYWDVPQPRAAAVVLHPHPLLGGTMNHHAPYRIARALRARAASSPRELASAKTWVLRWHISSSDIPACRCGSRATRSARGSACTQ